MTGNSLIRVRSYAPMTRRAVYARAWARSAPLRRSAGSACGPSQAAANVTFFGWQGYDAGLAVDDFLKKNDITLNTTYIGNNDEIVTKLTAGGVGSIDIVTPYMGYVPLLVALDVIQPIDEALVPNLADVMPRLPQRQEHQHRRQALRACPSPGARRRCSTIRQ